ncbi:MAG: Fis family transcriptional regulator [Gammaproteobacteria bacterium]|nr:Fis family transcriptional regulator [Gammaproteobacteria bacterium]
MEKTKIATEGKATNLANAVEALVSRHIKTVGKDNVINLHDMVFDEVEPALIEMTMEHSRYNQCRAAQYLGISRGTLRTKLKKYFDDKYCKQRGNE